jgi:hypothetical protein
LAAAGLALVVDLAVVDLVAVHPPAEEQAQGLWEESEADLEEGQPPGRKPAR